jgi:hypothetical protein
VMRAIQSNFDEAEKISKEWWESELWTEHKRRDLLGAAFAFGEKYKTFRERNTHTFGLILGKPLDTSILKEMRELRAQYPNTGRTKLDRMWQVKLAFRAIATEATQEQKDRLQQELDRIAAEAECTVRNTASH